MLTLCWAAKGGCGTTVVAATLALIADQPTLAIDLDGDLPTVLGLGDATTPGIHDWLRSTADASRLRSLALDATAATQVVPAGTRGPINDVTRWSALAQALAAERCDVIVDAGAGDPPPELVAVAGRRLLVTRSCYLAVRAAATTGARPTGVVLIDEPGRVLRRPDVEQAVGAPVVAELLLDPAVARAVDTGLLTGRLPRAFRRRIERVAA